METSEEKCGAAPHKKIELQASLASIIWRQVLQAYFLYFSSVLFGQKIHQIIRVHTGVHIGVGQT